MNTLTTQVFSANTRQNRPVDRCKDTGRLRIGIAHVPSSHTGADSMSLDAMRIQRALLDPRTAQPQSTLQRLAGAVWQWL